MSYKAIITYDVEDDYNGETLSTYVREDKEFDSWDDVIMYCDGLNSCPWISNLNVSVNHT